MYYLEGDGQQRAVLLSIKPKYFERIQSGRKTVELRRRFPRLVAGSLAIVYASAPLSAVVGVLVVGETLRSPPEDLWELVGDKADVTRDEFERYYIGAEEANGLVVNGVYPARPIPLAELRLRWPSFSPPQSYRYIAVKTEDAQLQFGPPDGESWIGVADL